MTITPQIIKKIAKLSRLKVSDEQMPHYQEKLNTIFEWIDQLQAVDVSTVDLHHKESHVVMHERADVVTAPNRVVEVLQNAPLSQHDMYAVPKVVE